MEYSPEDYSSGVASFDQFSEIAFNNADKARITTPYYTIIEAYNNHMIIIKNTFC